MNDRSIISRPGVYLRFPKAKSFLKSYTLGLEDWESVNLARLQRYVEEPHFSYSFGANSQEFTFTYGFASAQTDLDYLANAKTWFAIQAALKEEDGWFELWRQAVGYYYWVHRMNFCWHNHMLEEFNSGRRHQILKCLFLLNIGVNIGSCLSLGWVDWAADLTHRANETLHKGMYVDAGDGFGCRRTQHFMLRLIDDWQGWTVRQQEDDCQCAFDEPLFNALITQWRTKDIDAISHLLLAACDRHTQQSRFDSFSRNQFYDLPRRDFFYNPFEVLSVLRLREMHGLVNPKLDHPLLATPLGVLPPPTDPYSDSLLEAVLTQARREFPDF